MREQREESKENSIKE